MISKIKVLLILLKLYFNRYSLESVLGMSFKLLSLFYIVPILYLIIFKQIKNDFGNNRITKTLIMSIFFNIITYSLYFYFKIGFVNILLYNLIMYVICIIIFLNGDIRNLKNNELTKEEKRKININKFI